MREYRRVRIADIGRPERFRKDLGNIAKLAASMASRGQLQPIGLGPDLALVFGGRRLAAAEGLGWTEIDAVIIDGLDDALAALRAQRAENDCREPLRRTEMVELGRAIEALERPEAARRRAATQAKPGVGRPGGGKPATTGNQGKTRDKVAAALGIGARTYEQAKRVVEAAEADPGRMGDLPDLMDAESVHAAHEEMRRRRESDPAAGEVGRPPEVWQLAATCLDEVRRAMRKLSDIRRVLSGIADGPYRSLAVKAANTDPTVKLEWDGGTRKEAEGPGVAIVSRSYTCPALDSLTGLIAGLELLFEREAR